MRKKKHRDERLSIEKQYSKPGKVVILHTGKEIEMNYELKHGRESLEPTKSFTAKPDSGEECSRCHKRPLEVDPELQWKPRKCSWCGLVFCHDCLYDTHCDKSRYQGAHNIMNEGEGYERSRTKQMPPQERGGGPRTLSDAVDLARGLNNPPSRLVRFSSWENCPLCDSTHIEVHEDRILKPEVVCTDCGISLQGETVFEIKAKWNKREPICDCGVCNTCLRQKLYGEQK